jgi:hypothetical protein
MSKYRFKKQFEDATISIAILSKTINKDNLTDYDVETLKAKFPNKFDHNFEEIPTESEQVEVVEPKGVRKPRTTKAK